MGLTVTSVIRRNIYVNGHLASMRLEPEVWRALEDITRFKSQSINTLSAWSTNYRATAASPRPIPAINALHFFKSACKPAITAASRVVGGLRSAATT